MPRKAIIEEEPELVWDKKKLIIAGLILLLLVAGFIYVKYFFLTDTKSSLQMSVKGASTSDLGTSPSSHTLSFPSQEDVQGKIAQLEEQVTHLSVKDIASSSPQVQQVLKQLQTLPSYPASQAKAACVKICSQL